jgi:hypothetical protein
MKVGNLVCQRTIEGLQTRVTRGVAKAVKAPQNGHRSQRDREELNKSAYTGLRPLL